MAYDENTVDEVYYDEYEFNQKVRSLRGRSSIFTDSNREESDRLIFVKRIPGVITAEEFATIVICYAREGPILDIKYRRHTGGDKTAFALVYFESDADGKRAIRGLNGKHINHYGQRRILSAERAARWTQQVSRTNLYVTNLPRHWTGEDLKAVFDKFGKVLQATVLPHPQLEEQNSGAGFVRFVTEDCASEALKTTNLKPATNGSEQIIEVKYAKANVTRRHMELTPSEKEEQEKQKQKVLNVESTCENITDPKTSKDSKKRNNPFRGPESKRPRVTFDDTRQNNEQLNFLKSLPYSSPADQSNFSTSMILGNQGQTFIPFIYVSKTVPASMLKSEHGESLRKLLARSGYQPAATIKTPSLSLPTLSEDVNIIPNYHPHYNDMHMVQSPHVFTPTGFGTSLNSHYDPYLAGQNVTAAQEPSAQEVLLASFTPVTAAEFAF